MNAPSLLVLAAGMGSRYGGLKQLDGVGPNRETIMDYTVKDAIDAGFGKVVFVIRKDFESQFNELIISKYQDKISIKTVFQDLTSEVPANLIIDDRKKPWGTGHAVLVAKNEIHEPFAVVNADDFYGKEAIHDLANFLTTEASDSLYGMIGYPLVGTLSNHGTVSRGVCHLDKKSHLIDIVETTKIKAKKDQIVAGEDEGQVLDPESLVSMNLWGLHPSFFSALEKKFNAFIEKEHQSEKTEFYLPFAINEMLQAGEIKVKVIPSQSQWYGVTYKDDLESVQESLGQLISDGIYPTPLW